MGSVMASSTTQEMTNSSTNRSTKRTVHGKTRQAIEAVCGTLQPAAAIMRIITRNCASGGASLMSIAVSRRSRVAAAIGMDGGLEQRRGDAGNGDHRQQRHLQAGIEQAARAHGQQAQRGKSNGVQRAALAVDQPAQQVERHHPKRALHRRGKAGEERVSKRGKRW